MSPRRFLGLLARGAGWIFAARVGSAVALLGVNALLARLVGLEELGVYALYLSTVTLVGSVASAGTGNSCTRLIAENTRLGRHGLVRRAALVGFLVTSAVSCALAALCFWWPLPRLLEASFGRPIGHLEAAFASVWLVAFAVRYAGGSVYRGLRVMSLAAIYQGMGANFVVLLVLAAAYLGLGEGSLLLALGTMAAASLVTTVACWVGIARRLARLPPDPAPAELRLREFLGRSALMALPGVFQHNSREVCVWIVGATAGLPEVALFGAANRLMQVVALPAVAVNQVMQPFVAEFRAAGHLERNARALRLSTAVVFVLMLGLTGLVALFGGWALGTLFRPEFAAAYTVLLWLAVGRLLRAFFGPTFAVLSMTGHERLLARDAPLQFVCLAGFGYLAGQLAGAAGVAAVYCLTLAAFAAYRSLTVRRRLGLWLTPELHPTAMLEIARQATRRRGERGATGRGRRRALVPVADAADAAS